MKRYCLYFIFTFCLLVSCQKVEQICCPCYEAEGISDKYLYPIRPGMEEWTKLKSHQEMVDVCQIPCDILNKMCTIGLVDSYLDYPILFTIFAYNNINEGLDQISVEFNGFTELQARTDGATKLFQRYKALNPSSLDSSWTSLERGKFKQTFQFYELTLGYHSICCKLSKVERVEVLKDGLDKLTNKEILDYSGFSLITNTYLIARILEQEEFVPFLDYINRRDDMKLFLNGNLFFLSNTADGDTIKFHALNYLVQN